MVDKVITAMLPQEMHVRILDRCERLDETLSRMVQRLFELELQLEPKPPEAEPGWKERREKADAYEDEWMDAMDNLKSFRSEQQHRMELLKKLETGFIEHAREVKCEWCGTLVKEVRRKVWAGNIRLVCRECDEDPSRIYVDNSKQKYGFVPARCCGNCLEAAPNGEGGAYCSTTMLPIQATTLCNNFRWAYLGLEPEMVMALQNSDPYSKIRKFLERLEAKYPPPPEGDENKWFKIFSDAMGALYGMCSQGR